MLGFGSVAQYSVADAGQQGANVTLAIDTSTLILTGQSIALNTSLPITKAQLTLTGGDFQNYGVAIDAGALSLSGGDVDFAITWHIDPTTLALTGQDLPFNVSHVISKSDLTLTGGDVSNYRVYIETATLTLSGDVILRPVLPIEPATLRLTAHDIRLFAFGGHGDPPKKRRRKLAKPFVRMIEVIGPDGVPKKVPLLERFAPPPPLELLPDHFGLEAPTVAPSPIDLPTGPAVLDAARLQDELEGQDALEAILAIPDQGLEAVREMVMAHAAIASIPDEAAEAARELVGDLLVRLLEPAE